MYMHIQSILMNDVSILRVLTTSPQMILTEEQAEEGFFEMLGAMIAPQYQWRSVTSLILILQVSIYAVLVLHFPPYLRIPIFSLKPLQLLPEDLRHFEFYRLFTAPLVCPDITNLIVSLLVIWSLCSYTEEQVGWRIIFVFCNLSSVIGYASFFTIPVTLIGMNMAFNFQKELNPNIPVNTRKTIILLNFIILGVFILLFYEQQDNLKYSVYAAGLYGIALGFVLGRKNQAANPSTAYQILKTASSFSLIFVHFALIALLVFKSTTFL